ncbi:MAG: hypothetical protein NW703_01575 [Nitrospiraceae bacterium]
METIIARGSMVVALVLAACAQDTVRLDPATRESLKTTAEIKVIHHVAPELYVPTNQPRVAYAGGGGYTALESQSRDLLIKEYDLKDPVLRVKTTFSAAAGKKLGGPTLTPVPAPFMIGEGPDRLKLQFGRETILDFATTYWGVLPVPFEPTDIVAYRARARLIRFPEGKILWQGGCDLEGKETSSGSRGANVQTPKTSGLKEAFDRLADTCADQLVAQFLGKEADK